ncbi:hypothetical protein EYR41_006077 [Orbilia oligospora]|uniref:Uncharacterized protein n=1 Tax=Orbilia oligospora TaxID=2813651 RepID=A0A8H2E009_ORBOL|nr:hypothetical protein EYR41_006077 [Orbilia oligospora]
MLSRTKTWGNKMKQTRKFKRRKAPSTNKNVSKPEDDTKEHDSTMVLGEKKTLLSKTLNRKDTKQRPEDITKFLPTDGARPTDFTYPHHGRRGYYRPDSKREFGAIIQEGLTEMHRNMSRASKNTSEPSSNVFFGKDRSEALHELSEILMRTKYRPIKYCLADSIRSAKAASYIAVRPDTTKEIEPKPIKININEHLSRSGIFKESGQFSTKTLNSTDSSKEVSQDIVALACLRDQKARSRTCESEEGLRREQRLLEGMDVSNTTESGETIIRAVEFISEMRWQQAVELLESFQHQPSSEPKLSVSAYFANAIATYALKDYDKAFKLCRRGLLVATELPAPAQEFSEFGALAVHILKSRGQEDPDQLRLYSSFIRDTHTEHPILVSIFQATISNAAPLTPEEHIAALPKLTIDLQEFELSLTPDNFIVGSPANILSALQKALWDNNIPLMKVLCSNEMCAKMSSRHQPPLTIDLEDPMPKYAWHLSTLLHVVASVISPYSSAMAQLLIRSGADISANKFERITPLHVCARHGNFDVAETLIKNGAPVDAGSLTGKSALHFAAWRASWTDDTRIMKLLIRAGANINKRNMGGYSALHWCMCDGSHTGPVELLLQTPGIDSWIRSNDHKSIMDLFLEKEEEHLRKGSKPRTKLLGLLKALQRRKINI